MGSSEDDKRTKSPVGDAGRKPEALPGDSDLFRELREEMVRRQLQGRDITDSGVLEAMRRVPRHCFVPASARESAYADMPLPIGEGQTISQPYIVALTVQLARAAPGKRALDVGTGSGYQTAILAEIVDHVYSIEIRSELIQNAENRLRELGYPNVTVRCGDGYLGWPEEAPFDLIVGAAAAPQIPQALVEQLAPGGRLVMPVGTPWQELTVVERGVDGKLREWSAGEVRFVPMIRKERLPG
jgi:protein-L-isoaspartate(D-aspartate) O-methyltransferase